MPSHGLAIVYITIWLGLGPFVGNGAQLWWLAAVERLVSGLSANEASTLHCRIPYYNGPLFFSDAPQYNR